MVYSKYKGWFCHIAIVYWLKKGHRFVSTFSTFLTNHHILTNLPTSLSRCQIFILQYMCSLISRFVMSINMLSPYVLYPIRDISCIFNCVGLHPPDSLYQRLGFIHVIISDLYQWFVIHAYVFTLVLQVSCVNGGLWARGVFSVYTYRIGFI